MRGTSSYGLVVCVCVLFYCRGTSSASEPPTTASPPPPLLGHGFRRHVTTRFVHAATLSAADAASADSADYDRGATFGTRNWLAGGAPQRSNYPISRFFCKHSYSLYTWTMGWLISSLFFGLVTQPRPVWSRNLDHGVAHVEFALWFGDACILR